MDENNNGKVFRALTERELDDLKDRLDEIKRWMETRPCAAHGERLAKVEVRAGLIALVVAALIAAGVRIFAG